MIEASTASGEKTYWSYENIFCTNVLKTVNNILTKVWNTVHSKNMEKKKSKHLSTTYLCFSRSVRSSLPRTSSSTKSLITMFSTTLWTIDVRSVASKSSRSVPVTQNHTHGCYNLRALSYPPVYVTVKLGILSTLSGILDIKC